MRHLPIRLALLLLPAVVRGQVSERPFERWAFVAGSSFSATRMSFVKESSTGTGIGMLLRLTTLISSHGSVGGEVHAWGAKYRRSGDDFWHALNAVAIYRLSVPTASRPFSYLRASFGDVNNAFDVDPVAGGTGVGLSLGLRQPRRGGAAELGIVGAIPAGPFAYRTETGSVVALHGAALLGTPSR